MGILTLTIGSSEIREDNGRRWIEIDPFETSITKDLEFPVEKTYGLLLTDEQMEMLYSAKMRSGISFSNYLYGTTWRDELDTTINVILNKSFLLFIDELLSVLDDTYPHITPTGTPDAYPGKKEQDIAIVKAAFCWISLVGEASGSLAAPTLAIVYDDENYV